MVVHTPQLKVGAVFEGRYKIHGVIGQGGMATVYKAHHLLLDIPLAIKIIRHDHNDALSDRAKMFRARFFQEARLVTKLIHPNIAQLREFGEADETGFYMVMNYCEGEALSALIARSAPLSIAKTLQITEQLLTAMIESHNMGIVHRDLKPDNIIVSPEGRAWVLDFGIAKMKSKDNARGEGPITARGMMIGTPLYMSPEQATGHEADARSDLYAIGLMVFEMLTGRRPHVSRDPTELLLKRLKQTPPSLSEASGGSSFPQGLESALAKALAIDPEMRWPDIKSFAEALRASTHTGTLEAPVSSIKAPGPHPTLPFRREVVELAETEEASHALDATLPWGESQIETTPSRPNRASSRTIAIVGALALAVVLTAGTMITMKMASPSTEETLNLARETFGPTPTVVPFTQGAPLPPAQIELGRALYFDTRLSKGDALSCNTCHPLDRFGTDGEALSRSANGTLTPRNTPTVFDVALHTTFKWDGSVQSLEKMCGIPLLSPDAHAMPSEEAVVEVLEAIPGYGPLFREAFPEDGTQIRFEQVETALSAFLRTLVSRSRFDAFVDGDLAALSDDEVAGLRTFIKVGCTTCHVDPSVGGTKTQKLGLIHAYESSDPGQFKVTGLAQHRGVFKVASLRQVAVTGPYLHDGSVASLPEMIRLMGHHQLDRDLDDDDVTSIATFLNTLTGRVPLERLSRPELPR